MDKIFVSSKKKLPEISQENLEKHLITRHYIDKKFKSETKYRHLCFRFPTIVDPEVIGTIIGVMQKDWIEISSEPKYLLTDEYFDCEYVFEVSMGNESEEFCTIYSVTMKALMAKVDKLNELGINFKMGEGWFDFLHPNVFQIISRKSVI